jgi:hypothetical protein
MSILNGVAAGVALLELLGTFTMVHLGIISVRYASSTRVYINRKQGCHDISLSPLLDRHLIR